jgi:hypothetical protein
VVRPAPVGPLVTPVLASLPGFVLVLAGIVVLVSARSDRIFDRVFRPSAVRQYQLQARLGGSYQYGVERHVAWARRFLIGLGVLLEVLGVVTVVAVAIRVVVT